MSSTGLGVELNRRRDQMLKRVCLYLGLRRHAAFAAAVGLAVALARAVPTHGHLAPVGVVVLSFSAGLLAAFDIRRLRSLNMQIQSLARTMASLV